MAAVLRGYRCLERMKENAQVSLDRSNGGLISRNLQKSKSEKLNSIKAGWGKQW